MNRPTKDEIRKRVREFLDPKAPDFAVEELVEEQDRFYHLMDQTDATGDAYPEFCFIIERLLSFVFEHYEDGYRDGKKREFQMGELHRAFQAWQADIGFGKDKANELFKRFEGDDTQHAHELVKEARGWCLQEYIFLERDGLPLPISNLIEWTCDWLEAIVHQVTHADYYEFPEFFDPSKEASWLSRLGAAQATLGHADPKIANKWLETIRVSARHYKDSPVWLRMGKAMSERHPRTHVHAELDGLVIACWPLVKHYNWTYPDLLNVVNELLPKKTGYPYKGYEDLAAHCRLTLGLTKSGRGKSANGMPVGWHVAQGIRWLPRSELNRNISVFPHP